MKKITQIALFVLLVSNTSAQYLDNPSFEGPPGIGITPPDWLPFDQFSTPDTEPLECDDFSASHGDSFITLVARGSASEHPGSVENCQAALQQVLQAGFCYSISVDLASRDDVGHYVFGTGFMHYSAPVRLRAYGSTNGSEKGELLFETEPITKAFWETQSFAIKPSIDISYLLLEARLEQNDVENGSIQIDNLVIDESAITRVMSNDTLEITDLPYTLVASEGQSYSWSPGTGLSCYDCQSPQVNNPVSETYTCSLVSSTTGCPENELFLLTFLADTLEPEPEQEFKIPNVFTPNGDHFNDLFEISGLPPFSSLIVFNRSGREVYRSDQYNNDWGGTDIDGSMLPAGTYWYVLITPGLSGKHKGQVYIKTD